MTERTQGNLSAHVCLAECCQLHEGAGFPVCCNRGLTPSVNNERIAGSIKRLVYLE